ncbi:MAG: DUF418 domain-containing protein [Pseudomonadota bacterium]|nr:DUF418 domain-containing protein [Pseudomonadota bacterium]
MTDNAPVRESQRIESLDVLRGFALLGILLLNIIGFGFISSGYVAPSLTIQSPADMAAWILVDLTAEGAMRGLFSILFGAGVVLFLGRDGNGRSWLHMKRTSWLLIFGLINGYLLLWTGDILVTYALCGFILFFARNVSGRRLLITSCLFIALLSLYNSGMYFGLSYLQDLATEASTLQSQGKAVPAELIAAQSDWHEFISEYRPAEAAIATEIAARGDSYVSAFLWTAERNTEILLGSLWFILLPDAFALMLLGMALFKLGVLQGEKHLSAYRHMAIFGIGCGLLINAYELWVAHASNFDTIASFNQIAPTYHLGRTAMTIGWIGVVILALRNLNIGWRLAAVGRMALTNYLMHSLICLFIFTGAGFGLVNQLARWQLYGIVLAIWIAQLYLSPWWLARYHYGPMEWLWRGLTYGHFPPLKRSS